MMHLPRPVSAWLASVAAAAMMLSAPAARADDPWPATSPDGLQLVKTLPHGAVYIKQGATFSQYQRVALLDCFVAFAKNWERDYNEDIPGLQGRVTQSDVDRITKAVAQEFRNVFTAELQAGGYAIVDVAAPDVLILRPAILNLIVNAPEIDTAPPMELSVVSSAGQMTLYLEMWDSTTNTLLARVVDTEADNQGGGGNPVANKMAADRILKSWADRLVKALDTVRTQPAAPAAPSP